MFVKVLRSFALYSEGQIIETNKEALPTISVETYLLNGVLQKVDDYTEKLDVVSDYLQYFGKSYAGAIESEAVWTVTKTTVSGTITTRDVFHNVSWADRNVL